MTGLLLHVALFPPGTTHDCAIGQAGPSILSSLSRPGGNVTGNATQVPAVTGKQVELLKEAVPYLSRVAILWNPSNPAYGGARKELEAAIQGLGIQTIAIEVVTAEAIEDGLNSALAGHRVEALLVIPDAVFYL